ncbi:MAG: hypothetical protein EB156_05545 [Euryarchaeota archaeon]|nr:hypothetical protein [Euryarchaeota archaeon]NDG22080.1 hypothetical protein [Euryarchaeota archaeon]
MVFTGQLRRNMEEKEDKRSSIAKAMADRYGMTEKGFIQILNKTVMPSKATPEQAAAFLLICERYELDPFASEVYAFPANGTVKALIGVDGYVTIANRNPNFDGITYEEIRSESGELEGISCSVFRKDRKQPTVVTEYMSECRGNSPIWRKMPSRMLRHKATIQSIRLAFGLSGLGDVDEYGDNLSLIETKEADVVDLNEIVKGEKVNAKPS